MINIKFCKKCKQAFDMKDCPYCRQKELELKKGNENYKTKIIFGVEELKKEGEKNDTRYN